jgi:hypothetical protein
VSDIFREVEEDVRKERFERLWKAYGDYVIALIVLMILGVGGWQLWERYEANQRAKASTTLIADQRVANPVQAAAAFDALSKTAPGGYGELAKLGEANALSVTAKRADAVAIYKDIANSDNGPLGAVARLRAAWLVADTAPPADLESLLSPLNTPTSSWRQMAREVLAYNDYKSGKLLAAQAGFDALINDPDTPDALRSRARAFSAFLHEGGAANFGTVPPPAPTPAPGAPPGGTPPAGATP